MYRSAFAVKAMVASHHRVHSSFCVFLKTKNTDLDFTRSPRLLSRGTEDRGPYIPGYF